jgi:signal transduction histidine kinase
MLTAKTETEDKLAGLDTGADDYLTKPFKTVEIVAKARAGMRIQKLQKSLAEKNEELQRLNDLKDEFLNMAAHDMRNPLSVIKLWSESMMDGLMGDLGEKVQHGIKIIMNHSDAMLQLINDLLDIQKIESGKLELKFEIQKIQEVLETFYESNKILAEDKGIAFHMEVEDALPAFAFAKAKVGEVVNNLLSNALKFSKQGDSVTLRLKKENDDFCRVEVSDTGQGIRKEELHLLFGKFQQISTKSTGGEKGTGLGLAICKKIIELHHGEIAVNSVYGDGATFYFTLPFSQKI